MSSLFASLISSANALDVFERALEVTQNNVSNASAPGYVRQRLPLQSMAFQPEAGLAGGIRAGDVQSARDQYAEQAVCGQVASLGYFNRKAESLADIQGNFDISGQTGIPGALNSLLQSFSAWSVSPISTASRQAIIDRAGDLAAGFQQAGAQLQRNEANTEHQVLETVTRINHLTATVRDYNAAIRRGDRGDPGLDARLHATLEELSEAAGFSAITQADGSVTVLLGGQTPLVIGDKQYPILPPVYSGIPPSLHVQDASGGDITAQLTQGNLGGLVEIRNGTIPTLLGGLNLLAKTLADRVNEILATGQDPDGSQPGTPLFQYSSDTSAAATLLVNPAITPDQLAPVDAGPPAVSNGIALKLSALADSPEIQGFTFNGYYGELAASVGRDLSEVQERQSLQKELVAQARNLRSQMTGVSLDEEAIVMMQFQRAYQATARMVSVLNDLTEEAVNLLR